VLDLVIPYQAFSVAMWHFNESSDANPKENSGSWWFQLVNMWLTYGLNPVMQTPKNSINIP
jgi:hypothetical protein